MSGKVKPSSRANAKSGVYMPSKTARQAALLYERFTGHEAEAIAKVRIPALPREVAAIGTCDGILYTTVRDGVTEKYIHKFKAKDKPLFCVTPDGTQILLIGGSYDFTERGIVDGSDFKTRREMGID